MPASYRSILEVNQARSAAAEEIKTRVFSFALRISDIQRDFTLSPVIRRELILQLVPEVEELLSINFHLFDDEELFDIWLAVFYDTLHFDGDSDEEMTAERAVEPADDAETDFVSSTWSAEDCFNGDCVEEELAFWPDDASDDLSTTDDDDCYLVL